MTKIDPSYAYNYYRRLGYSDNAAAGIVGNIHAESGFNTGASGDQGSAHGLTQVRGERWQGLQNYAQQHGMDPSSPDAQLGYVDYEMRSGADAGAGRAFQALQTAQTPADAAAAFMHNYERPNADPSINNIAGRQQFANTIFGTDPNAGVTPVNLTAGATNGAGLASLTLPTATAAAATPTPSADPMAGVFTALMASAQQPQAPAPQPAPMARRVDTRTPDEKMAETSQTPNVYYDRLRMQQNG